MLRKEERRRWRGRPHLQRVLRVVQAVDSDVVLHGGAGDGPEDGQLQALDGGGAQRLAHQAVRAQRLCEDVAGLFVHLDVARRGEILLPDHHHVLSRAEENVTRCKFKCPSEYKCMILGHRSRVSRMLAAASLMSDTLPECGGGSGTASVGPIYVRPLRQRQSQDVFLWLVRPGLLSTAQPLCPCPCSNPNTPVSCTLALIQPIMRDRRGITALYCERGRLTAVLWPIIRVFNGSGGTATGSL